MTAIGIKTGREKGTGNATIAAIDPVLALVHDHAHDHGVECPNRGLVLARAPAQRYTEAAKKGAHQRLADNLLADLSLVVNLTLIGTCRRHRLGVAHQNEECDRRRETAEHGVPGIGLVIGRETEIGIGIESVTVIETEIATETAIEIVTEIVTEIETIEAELTATSPTAALVETAGALFRARVLTEMIDTRGVGAEADKLLSDSL